MVKNTVTFIVLLALSLLAGAKASQPTFRVVTNLVKYAQTGNISEGSPGLFFFWAGGGPTAVLTVTTTGTKTVLTSFPSGYAVGSALIGGASGRFYSTFGSSAEHGLFSVDSTPGKQVYSTQNYYPSMTQNLPDGSLLAISGLISTGDHYLSKVDLKGKVTPIYDFTTAVTPLFGIVYASDGNYYGTTAPYSDPTGIGTFYRISPAGSYSAIYNFPAHTFMSYTVALLQASDGNLYGTTPNGGANGNGTVFKMTLSGKYTLLYSFPSGSFNTPDALIEGSDGNLYGVTLRSQLFRLNPKTGNYTTIYSMTFLDGECTCYLTLGSDGIIYGTAGGGGSTGAGTVFALDAGLPKPAPRAQHFTPKSGPVGTSVTIWGQNLLSASVKFNGVPATTVSNSGSNYVLAKVPSGATTGPISVTTPGGTFTTKASFTVQ